MTDKDQISPVLMAAMQRAAQFLRAPAEQPGQRAYHFLHLASTIETAKRHAIMAGQDDIAFKLSALRSEADNAFGDAVNSTEMAHLHAEIAECDRLLASAKRPRRRLVKSGSPGHHAKAAYLKRGATITEI